MAVKFSKYEGAGNDFIIIDNRTDVFGALEEAVRALCDRRFGIGADGLILLEEACGADFRMRYFNADGPEATMCGNGGRCIALYAHHLGIGGPRKTFLAVDGLHSAEIFDSTADTAEVALGMSDAGEVESMAGGFFVDTGSPHYVEFVDDVDNMDVFGRGREMRNDAAFAGRGGANINFVQVLGPGKIKLRTYERGVEDETLACGTGAVASALAAWAAGNEEVTDFAVYARGGRLNASFSPYNGKGFSNIVLEGPARRVFEGEFDTENFIGKA